jgi:hypothetical protein
MPYQSRPFTLRRIGKMPELEPFREDACGRLALHPMAVEKPPLLKKRSRRRDRKCPPKSRTSFIGHPSAMLFLRISWEGVFQQRRARPGGGAKRKGTCGGSSLEATPDYTHLPSLRGFECNRLVATVTSSGPTRMCLESLRAVADRRKMRPP